MKDIINKIERNEIYLPAIQRKFLRDHEQIEKLFDSIMRSYPIGTFLFWIVRSPSIQNYVKFSIFLEDIPNLWTLYLYFLLNNEFYNIQRQSLINNKRA